MRTIHEINDQIDLATDWVFAGESAVFGLTYEDGVRDALNWAVGNEEDLPIEEKYEKE